MWKAIPAAPADAIFGLTEAFKKDPNPAKVNLGAGVYMTDQGTTPVLNCVKDAERILLGTEASKSYLPISGDPVYGSCVQQLLFGAESEVVSSARAVTAHTPGGTGALRIGAELLKSFHAESCVWVSSPTWANHEGIFNAAGFPLKSYPYYNPATKGLNFAALRDCLAKIPPGDIVLLHACCHNPSGVDLSAEQWQTVAELAKERGFIPFLDFAYQGFGSGIEEDRVAVETFADSQIDFLIASSFSKNLGLYNERTGAITVVCPSSAESVVALSHLKRIIRVCYSNPPAHGGLIAKTILSEPSLEQAWRLELKEMCDRIVAMRAALVGGLKARGVDQDFSYIKAQRGMFSFSGLDDQTVNWLRANKSIYVVGGGRINVAGLTSQNIAAVCDAVAEGLNRQP